MSRAATAPPPPIAGDLRDPHSVRSAENFPVAMRILPRAVRRDLCALYGYARYVDDLGDEPLPGADRPAALDHVESQVRDLYAGRPVTLPVVCALAPTVAARALPHAPLRRLIQANRIDQTHTAYDTFDDLVGYCRYSANPVGELVLHVFGAADPDRLALSDRVCTALQLIEHLQDIRQDHRRGRTYLPREDLLRFGVPAADLDRPRATAALRDLVRFEAERARAWLDAGAPLVSTLGGWARLCVGGYIAGGRAALAALARADHDPLAAPVRTSARGVLAEWCAATVRSAG